MVIKVSEWVTRTYENLAVAVPVAAAASLVPSRALYQALCTIDGLVPMDLHIALPVKHNHFEPGFARQYEEQ